MRNQNFLSSYICIFLPMMCYLYLNTKSEKLLVIVALLFSTLMYSKTLGGYITFAFMGLCVIAISIVYSNTKKDTLFRILKLLLTITITFMVITFFRGNTYVSEIKATKTEVTNLATNSGSFGSGRMTIWKAVLNVIDNNKMFGVGLDSLFLEIRKDEYKNDSNKAFFAKYNVDKAHSEPMHIAATSGIPSAVIYLALVSTVSLKLLLIAHKKNIASKKKVDTENNEKDKNTIYITMITISILSYLMQSMINISVVQVAPIFWAILGLGAGITLEEKMK